MDYSSDISSTCVVGGLDFESGAALSAFSPPISHKGTTYHLQDGGFSRATVPTNFATRVATATEIIRCANFQSQSEQHHDENVAPSPRLLHHPQPQRAVPKFDHHCNSLDHEAVTAMPTRDSAETRPPSSQKPRQQGIGSPQYYPIFPPLPPPASNLTHEKSTSDHQCSEDSSGHAGKSNRANITHIEPTIQLPHSQQSPWQRPTDELENGQARTTQAERLLKRCKLRRRFGQSAPGGIPFSVDNDNHAAAKFSSFLLPVDIPAQLQLTLSVGDNNGDDGHISPMSCKGAQMQGTISSRPAISQAPEQKTQVKKHRAGGEHRQQGQQQKAPMQAVEQREEEGRDRSTQRSAAVGIDCAGDDDDEITVPQTTNDVDQFHAEPAHKSNQNQLREDQQLRSLSQSHVGDVSTSLILSSSCSASSPLSSGTAGGGSTDTPSCVADFISAPTLSPETCQKSVPNKDKSQSQTVASTNKTVVTKPRGLFATLGWGLWPE